MACSCNTKYKYILITADGITLEYASNEAARTAQSNYGGAIQKRMA